MSPGALHSQEIVNKLFNKPPTANCERLWVKNDPRGHGGDGLGPVFNGQSCVACHNLGGSGGAGTVGSNIEIATATVRSTAARVTRTHSARILAREGLNLGSVAVRKRAPVVYKQPAQDSQRNSSRFSRLQERRFTPVWDRSYISRLASQFPGSTGRS